ncbi:MAG: tripartite tricarboxylate transporter permease [Deltaproteobacteria bacterium]|nr:MAG: tripartite tricarboxylate transporter permease [Deltaproteobacteria bacterium]
MDVINNLMGGFATCLTPYNLWMAVLGAFLGTMVGILPGLGPSATMAIILPITFGMDPTPAMIMLCALYYGAMYGGSTTSILVNVPGEASSVVTAIEGHQLARQGKAGTALGLSAIGSFFAGIMGTIGLAFTASTLAEFSLKFGPAEMFSLVLMGMFTIIYVGGKDVTKSLMSMAIGLGLGTVGTDIVEGKDRFVYGISELLDGVDFVILVMGTFGIAEVLESAEEFMKIVPMKVKFWDLFPSWKDTWYCRWAIIRGTCVGFFICCIPGSGPTIASFLSYGVEKSVSKYPERFGTGVMEGVAGPESSNNAAVSGAMVPMFALGIPGSGATAVLLGGLILYGLKPGPMLFVENADFVWAVMASMFIGNIILIIMNLPLVPVFASLLRIPYGLIYPAILIVCIVGAYAVATGLFEVGLMLVFAICGYFMKKGDIPAAPMLMALLMGPMMERSLYQALNLSHGSMLVFIQRPISATLLSVIVLMSLYVGIRSFRGKKAAIEEAEE